MQELRADPVVEPDPPRHLLHIGTDPFAEVGDLVDEGDLGGQEGIGRIFGQFGRAAGRPDDRCPVQVERPVELLHDRAGSTIFRAEHDAVGSLEILDRGAFAQELRVGHDGPRDVGPGVAQDALDLVAGPHRNGRLSHHDRGARDGNRDISCRPVDVGQVGVSVTASRRRADRDHHHLGA